MFVQYVDGTGQTTETRGGNPARRVRKSAGPRLVIVDDPEVRRHQILGSLDLQPSPSVRFPQIARRQRNMHLVYRGGYESLQQTDSTLHIGDYREEFSAGTHKPRERCDAV